MTANYMCSAAFLLVAIVTVSTSLGGALSLPLALLLWQWVYGATASACVSALATFAVLLAWLYVVFIDERDLADRERRNRRAGAALGGALGAALGCIAGTGLLKSAGLGVIGNRELDGQLLLGAMAVLGATVCGPVGLRCIEHMRAGQTAVLVGRPGNSVRVVADPLPLHTVSTVVPASQIFREIEEAVQTYESQQIDAAQHVIQQRVEAYADGQVHRAQMQFERADIQEAQEVQEVQEAQEAQEAQSARVPSVLAVPTYRESTAQTLATL
jgi:hypothetical protein